MPEKTTIETEMCGLKELFTEKFEVIMRTQRLYNPVSRLDRAFGIMDKQGNCGFHVRVFMCYNMYNLLLE